MNMSVQWLALFLYLLLESQNILDDDRVLTHNLVKAHTTGSKDSLNHIIIVSNHRCNGKRGGPSIISRSQVPLESHLAHIISLFCV